MSLDLCYGTMLTNVKTRGVKLVLHSLYFISLVVYKGPLGVSWSGGKNVKPLEVQLSPNCITPLHFLNLSSGPD